MSELSFYGWVEVAHFRKADVIRAGVNPAPANLL